MKAADDVAESRSAMMIFQKASGFPRLVAGFERGFATLGLVQSAIAPFFNVALRLWLAQLVWLPGAVGVAMWTRALAMPPPPTPMGWISSHPAGSVILLICPPLLVAGLGVRLVALPMLALAIISLRAYGGQLFEQISLALLFGWYLVAGAGPLSLDRLLARGIFATALPFAKLAGRALAGLAARGTPIMLLGIRLFLATSLATGSGIGGGGMAGAGAITCAVLLAAGLLTRLAALPLLGFGAMAMMEAPSTAQTGWTMLAALIAIYGPGAISADWLFRNRVGKQVMRQWPAEIRAASGHRRVVIIGGGFGGIAAAKALRHCDCAVTIIDRHNYHLFQPLLYQVATGTLSPADIALPIRGLFRDQANVRVMFGRAEAVDTEAKTVLTASGETVGYDMLVIATGARHAYFGHDAWEPYAPGLKTIDDATGLRRRILLAFELAETATDETGRRDLLTFGVIGGGPTGVELAGAIAELARRGLAHEFRTIEPATARVILFQAGGRILPTFPDQLSDAAARSLRELGVEVRVNAAVEAVDDEGITASGERIGCRTTFWAAGVAASPAAAWLGAEADRAGRVVVGADLSVPGMPDVFVIGDTALANAWDGKPVPGLAQAAKQGGKYVAGVIRARIEGKDAPPPFRYRHAGSLATIGRRAAVADFGRIRLSGVLAWWLWGCVHILFLAGARNRLTVMVEWFWAYLTFGRGTRLITGDADIVKTEMRPRATMLLMPEQR